MSEACADAFPLVAVLCADWCGVCREYRPTFEALARQVDAIVQFAWVDIEDDEAVLGDVEADNFPTLLIALGDEIRFFGPVRARAATTVQLLQQARTGALPVVDDERLHGLPARVRAFCDARR